MRTEQSPVDGVVDSVLVPAQPSRPNPGRARARVKSRDHFSLLVVRGDGARVVRFNFTRPVAVGTFVGLAFAISVVGALARDWTQLRELTREARTFARQIADQRETIDSFNRRAAELRQEMMGWRELHARIWEPFGPELVPGARDKGIGGGATKLPDRLSPKDEVERLAESVTEQGEHLRALDRLMARAGKAVGALPSRWPVRGAANYEFGNRLPLELSRRGPRRPPPRPPPGFGCAGAARARTEPARERW